MWLLETLFTPNTILPKIDPEDICVDRKDKLLQMKQLLDAHQIDFYLTQGTCLGAIREKNFIEYDHDIDLAFYEWDAKKLLTLVPKLEDQGFFIEEVTKSNLRLQLAHCKATMDLWILHKPNFFYTLMGYKWWVNNCLLKPNYFNPESVQTVDLFNTQFRVPVHIEDYLVEHYGTDWEIPKKNHNAIYRGKISQFITFLFVTSTMPKQFSGIEDRCTWKPWASKLLKMVAPNSKLTQLYKHPDKAFLNQ